MWRVLSSSIGTNDPLDEIIEILMECTNLIEQMEGVQSEKDVQQLMNSCWNLRVRTGTWYARFESINGTPLYTTTPDEGSVPRSDASKKVFPERYEFTALEVAETHMLYWGALLIVYSLFHSIELQKERFSQSRCSNKEESEFFLNAAELYANQICRGVGYFIQPHMHILGGHNLIFPVSMASQFYYLNDFHDQYQWCQEVFIALESTGLGVAHVLRGTPWSRYREATAPESVIDVIG